MTTVKSEGEHMWAIAYWDDVRPSKHDLTDIGVEAWYPVGWRWTKPRKKHSPIKVSSPAFGSNVMFVRYDRRWHRRVENLPGFRRFITIDGWVALCNNDEIERVRRDELAGFFDDDNGWRVGERVMITGGIIEGGNGVIIMIDGNRLKLLIDDWNYFVEIDACNVRRLAL
jgi:transcription antitermination factor NusG